MKRILLSLAVFVVLLLSSCFLEPNYMGKYDFDRWNPNDGYYSILYDPSSGTYSSDYSNVMFLEKGEGDFTIVNFADIQISNGALNKSSEEVVTFRNIADTIVSGLEPNLITFTGDFGDYGDSTASLKYIGNMLDSYGIPWAAVLGNHDNESIVTIKKSRMLENFSNSMYASGPSNLGKIEHGGKTTQTPVLGNYVINIMNEGKLVNSLIFMNTGSMHYYSQEEINEIYHGKEPFGLTQQWGCLSQAQIEWYKWAVKSAKAYEPDVASTLFVHIPIYAYVYAIGSAIKGAPDIYDTQSFIDYCREISYEESFTEAVWNPGYDDSFGVFHDTNLGTCSYDDHVFEAIKECGSTNLVICGHDHTNNIVVTYEGVTLAYGTKTGIGSYHDENLSGATVIRINEFETSIEHVLI